MSSLARGLAIALPLTAASSLHAESPVGNLLSPSGLDTTLVVDERGMTLFREGRRRSPAGFLYAEPWQPVVLSEFRGDYRIAGSLELGVVFDGGDEDETRFERYGDFEDSARVAFLSLSLLEPESGLYTLFEGGAAGRDDEYFRLEAGVPGQLRLRASFDRVPHGFANDADILFAGVGHALLTLPPPLVPGDNTAAEVGAALVGIGKRSLSLERDRTHISIDYRRSDRLKFVASYAHEDRDGSRAYGGSLGFPGVGNSVSDTAEAIDHRTQNVSGGLQYGGERVQWNLEYQGSFFRNDHEALIFENPFFVGDVDVERGRFALPPDNDWHNLKAELSVEVPWRGRLTLVASGGRMLQDDDLLPPTVNTGLVAGVDLDSWNTRAALPRRGADAEIDTRLLHAVLRFHPWKSLRVEGRIRSYVENNDTRYTAFNPLTGETGYVTEDGALAATIGRSFERILTAGVPIEDFRFRSSPFDRETLEWELGASYRTRGGTRIALRYEREEVDRDERERRETREDRVRLELGGRALSRARWRLSYEFADRDGSRYVSDPFGAFFASSQPGFVSVFGVDPPWALAQLRMPDLASRDQQVANARVNALVRDDMDLAFAIRWVNDEFSADYGLERDRVVGVSVDWNYQPSPDLSAYLFASFERRKRVLSTIASLGPFSADPNAGGPVFPFANEWSATSVVRSGALGLGLRVRLRARVRLESDYVFSASREHLDYDFASAGALTPGLAAADAGDEFSSQRYRDHVLETSLRLVLREQLSVRLYHRYQRSSLSDLHQTGLVPVVAGGYFFAHTDEDFEVSVYGVSLQLRF